METTEPRFQRQTIAQPRQLLVRGLLILMGLGVFGLLVLCRILEPNTQGMGTHEQLGLPPCGFHEYFGLPCPSCGMTTSWCWFARGNVVKSFQEHVGGALLCLYCLLLAPWMIASGVRGRWVFGYPRALIWAVSVGLIGLAIAIGWIIKLWA